MSCSYWRIKVFKVAVAVTAVSFLGGWSLVKDRIDERRQEPQWQFAQAKDFVMSGGLASAPERIADVVEAVTPVAQNGNPDAQVVLGYCYEVMRIPFQEKARTLSSIEERELMDADGNVMGYGYQWAEGIKWYEVPAKWYLNAAQGGNLEAQRCIARFYRQGLGVPKDADEAARWEQKAGIHNHEDPDMANPLKRKEGDRRKFVDPKKIGELNVRVWKDWRGIFEEDQPEEELEPPPDEEPPPDVEAPMKRTTSRFSRKAESQ